MKREGGRTNVDISPEKAAEALGLTGEPAWFYLSFADDNGFLGGLVIEAMNMVHAVTRSHQEGLNPGGEVKILELPWSPPDRWVKQWANRLLTATEARELPEPCQEATT